MDRVIGAIPWRSASEKAGLTSLEGFESVPDDLRLRAAASDPAVHGPVRRDDRGVAGFARGGTLATDDRGDSVGDPFVEEPGGAAEEVAVHRRMGAG